MVYRARVISNETFQPYGYIIVRIGENCNDVYGMRDLAANPESISKSIKKIVNGSSTKYVYTDSKAYISSPMGSGYDYGMFYLPQVNSYGLVAKLDSDSYVWLGALYTMDNHGNVNCPSSSNKSENGIVENTNNIDYMNGAIVIKTKHTYLEDPLNSSKSKNSIDFRKRNAENLIVISEKEINILHNTVLGGTATVNTSYIKLNSEGVNINYTSEDGSIDTGLTIDNDGYAHFSQTPQKGTIVKIDTSADGVESDVMNGNKSSIIQQKYSSIDININGTHMAVTDGTLNIESSGDVNISSKGKVCLGTEGRGVLLAPSSASAITIDNVTLTASTKVFA